MQTQKSMKNDLGAKKNSPNNLKFFSLLKKGLGGIFAAILMTLSSVPVGVQFAKAASRTQPCLVTAYYSPLPGQSYYYRGSYEAELRFNGNGTNGASGAEVFVGMVAAPKSYAFGTKIDIPGLGIGQIEDRGGRIIEWDGVHRFDVWMGRGIEGLQRSLSWGARTLQCTVYQDAHGITNTLDFAHIPVNTKKVYSSSLFPQNLAQGDTGTYVEKLQKNLKELGYFEENVTGKYGDITTNSVFLFQKSQGIVSSWHDLGAGVFGPTTRSKLEKIVRGDTNPTQIIEYTAPEPSSAHQAEFSHLLPAGIGTGAPRKQVSRLQLILKQLEFYQGQISGTYDQDTIDAVFSFQKEYGVVATSSQRGAGYFGVQTQSKLTEVLAQRRASRTDFSTRGMVIELSLDEENETVVSPEQTITSPEKMVDIGERGDHVQELQQKLIALGYLETGLSTGYYGEKTAEAVAKFQKEQGLANDQSPWKGKFGKKTEEALQSVV